MTVTVIFFLASSLIVLLRLASAAPNVRECCTNLSDPEEQQICEEMLRRDNIYERIPEMLLQASQHTVYRVAACLEKRAHGRQAPRLHYHDAMCCDIVASDSERSDEHKMRCQRACHGAFFTPQLSWTEKVAEMVGCMDETGPAFSRLFANCVQLGHETKHGVAALFDAAALSEHHESDIVGFA